MRPLLLFAFLCASGCQQRGKRGMAHGEYEESKDYTKDEKSDYKDEGHKEDDEGLESDVDSEFVDCLE